MTSYPPNRPPNIFAGWLSLAAMSLPQAWLDNLIAFANKPDQNLGRAELGPSLCRITKTSSEHVMHEFFRLDLRCNEALQRTFVDLGCGRGLVCAAALVHAPCLKRVIGWDIDAREVAWAREHVSPAANETGGALTLFLATALGIPVSNTTAVLLGAFQNYGIQPGPQLFSSSSALVWALIASLYIGNIMLLVLNLPLVGLWVKLLKIPKPQLYAGILIFATVGVYGMRQSAFDLVLLSDTDEPPRARFGFPNVDRASVNRLREVVDPPRVKFEIVPSNYFDLNVEPRVAKAGVTPTAIYTAKSLFLTDIKTDSVRVEGTLRSWDYRQEQWPDKRVTKPLLPAIYER